MNWLDIPVGMDAGHANLTWGAFSEIFEGFLHDVSEYIGLRVQDRSSLEGIVTAVLVGNLDVLVSPLGEREKLARLLTAADLSITQSETTSDGTGEALDLVVPTEG